MAAKTHNGFAVVHDSGDTTTGRMFVNTIIWHSFASDSDALTVQQYPGAAGSTLIDSLSVTDVSGTGPVIIPFNRKVDGLTTTVTNGSVIYLLR